jgi:hypothetical protein
MSNLLIVTPTLGKSDFFESTVHSVLVLATSGLPIIYRVVGPLNARDWVTAKLSELTNAGVHASFIVEDDTSGLYSAINHAVKASADTDWCALTYINDDDCISPDFYQSWTNYLSVRDKRPFSYGKVLLIDETGCSLGRVPIESNPLRFEALLSQGISPLNQQGMIIPRALWDKLGGFRTEYKLCADLDFWLRAYRMSWPFKYCHIEVGQFRIRGGQLSGNIKKLQSEIKAVVERDAQRRIGAFEKFYSRWQFRLANSSIYVKRLIGGRSLRGMKIMSGK